MDRIFLAVVVFGVLLLAGATGLFVFYQDDKSVSLLRHPPGIGLMEPRHAFPVHLVALP
jgi:hypothetical protein